MSKALVMLVICLFEESSMFKMHPGFWAAGLRFVDKGFKTVCIEWIWTIYFFLFR